MPNKITIRILMRSILEKINTPWIQRYYIKIARTLVRMGITPPTASVTPKVMQKSWEESTNHDRLPELFLKEDRSQRFMFDLLLEDINKEARILEIGSSCGRSLNFLYNRGYKQLEGIEISRSAVELMRKEFPNLSDIKVTVGDASKAIKDFQSNIYDIVFCHSVLANIPPSGNSLLANMVRVSKKFILTAESEHSHSSYPRDLVSMFESLGTKQVYYTNIYHTGDFNHKIYDLEGSAFENSITGARIKPLTVRLFLKGGRP